MNSEVFSALAELAWPVLAAAIVVAFLPTLIRVARSRAFTVEFGDMEISVQDASDQIRRQIEDLQKQLLALQQGGQPAPVAVARAGESLPNSISRSGSILWVDDYPQNNAHEIAKLQDDGWEISTAESTKAAVKLLDARSEPPTVIISDMGRREGPINHKTAGLDLIREVRRRGLKTPIYIYASSNSVRRYSRKVDELDSNGITSSPLELFALVNGAASKNDPATLATT